jgi:transposase
MKFDYPVETNYKIISLEDYFDEQCVFCDSMAIFRRSSRVREIPDLGSMKEKVIVKLTVVRIECKKCKSAFTPEHPRYPPKYEYSRAIIEYALARSFYHNASVNEIVRDLKLLHQVEIPKKTVYGWMTKLGPTFTKTRLEEQPDFLPEHIKSITVDGTFVNHGKKVIGKKKAVKSLSVTKLVDGRYLLTWWE